MSAKETFTWSRAVEFHETDHAGVAHFSNYYRWMEAAEHAFLSSLGVPVTDGGLAWPRVQASADFKRPIRYGDRVKVSVVLKKLGVSSLCHRFELRVDDLADLCATGEMTTVCLDRQTRKACDIPGELRTRLAAAAQES